MGLHVLCVHFQDKSDCKQMKKKIICCESVLNFLGAVAFSVQTRSMIVHILIQKLTHTNTHMCLNLEVEFQRNTILESIKGENMKYLDALTGFKTVVNDS